MRVLKQEADHPSAAALLFAAFGLAVLPTIWAVQPALADDPTIVAMVDQARLVKVPAGTETLVIGNPTIADVTLLRQNNLMILTPRSFGETNFIALDGQGNPVAQSTIRVVNGTDTVMVQRGMARESYSCAPRCQPTERLGDDDAFLAKISNEVQAHTARLNGSAPPSGPGQPVAK